MPKELYKLEQISGRVAKYSPSGRVARYVRKFQVLKNPNDSPAGAVFTASQKLFAGFPRFSIFRNCAPYANLKLKETNVKEDESSAGCRVEVEQVFEIETEDSEV